ncbi:nucleoside deaminase [Agrilactobacillus fermenti]|uniref:nucleoside deaminase n=1 Tax=Agrilactobacillus fermenti TaxID=2586909 RepID=UPI0038B312EE
MQDQQAVDYYMHEAIVEAKKAAAVDEVPIGAIVVDHGTIVARSFNHRELSQNALAHAEILAINAACQAKHSWRLSGMDLFVTLEPCLMCAGAIINSRLDSVYYGAFDPKAGAAFSVTDVFALRPLNHHPQVIGGIESDVCGQLLTDFFRKIRRQRQAGKRPH